MKEALARLISSLIKLRNTLIMQESNRERLYFAAKASLGMDMSINAPDELGCADSVNNIYNKALGSKIAVPGTSTSQLFDVMESDSSRFQLVTEPEEGDIVISPTGYGSDPSAHGHMGIVGIYGIMSNDPFTGTFRENFTLAGWNQYFKKRGFPVLFFRCK